MLVDKIIALQNWFPYFVTSWNGFINKDLRKIFRSIIGSDLM